MNSVKSKFFDLLHKAVKPEQVKDETPESHKSEDLTIFSKLFCFVLAMSLTGARIPSFKTLACNSIRSLCLGLALHSARSSSIFCSIVIVLFSKSTRA